MWAAPKDVAFSQSAASVAAYDFVEVSLRVSALGAANPFMDAAVTGGFGMAGSTERVKVDGFCDSTDGSLFKIRFMPSKPGDYAYAVKYADKGFEKSYEGTFQATAGGRRGPIRVDPDHQRGVTDVAEPRALDVPAGIAPARAGHRYSVAVALQ